MAFSLVHKKCSLGRQARKYSCQDWINFITPKSTNKSIISLLPITIKKETNKQTKYFLHQTHTNYTLVLDNG